MTSNYNKVDVFAGWKESGEPTFCNTKEVKKKAKLYSLMTTAERDLCLSGDINPTEIDYTFEIKRIFIEPEFLTRKEYDLKNDL